MKMYNYKIGDEIRIREWNDMEKEYGLRSTTAINCKYTFTDAMKHLCGKKAKIISFRGKSVDLKFIDESGRIDFYFSMDMIEPIPSEVPQTPVNRNRSRLYHSFGDDMYRCFTYDDFGDSYRNYSTDWITSITSRFFRNTHATSSAVRTTSETDSTGGTSISS